MFIANLAHDLKPDGILAACVHPGWVAADMRMSAAQGGAREGDPGRCQVQIQLTILEAMLFRSLIVLFDKAN